MILWDFLRGPNRNEMQSWASSGKLGVRERAQLNQKIDMLDRVGFDLARSVGFLAATSGDFNHIFKLIVHSQRMLRPMLCRGPMEPNREVTFLCGAIEKDFKFHPSDAAGRADEHRRIILDTASAEQRRTIHERF